MTCFKKIAPLFLAAAFTFAAAPAFSQEKSTGVAECDQFVTAYFTNMMKADLEGLSAKKQAEYIHVMDQIIGLSEKIRGALADGTTNRQEAAIECKKMQDELKR